MIYPIRHPAQYWIVAEISTGEKWRHAPNTPIPKGFTLLRKHTNRDEMALKRTGSLRQGLGPPRDE